MRQLLQLRQALLRRSTHLLLAMPRFQKPLVSKGHSSKFIESLESTNTPQFKQLVVIRWLPMDLVINSFGSQVRPQTGLLRMKREWIDRWVRQHAI